MIKKNITVPKTARYFVTGEPSDSIEQVWFVCHGYAQLANYFIRNFEILNNGKNLIVAPEGLNRFYWKGFSERVVAGWMTKEDRADDIIDYVNYLDMVYSEVLSQFPNRKIKINVLGFSQGTATVCRWLANNKSKADNLILWAGSAPEDMNFDLSRNLFNSIKTFLIIGDDDEFINESQIDKYQQLLHDNSVVFEMIRFKGKHEIHQETLLSLDKML